jgi:hypothetical protein
MSAPVVSASPLPPNARKPRGAETRIRELLSEVKTLKCESERVAAEHKAELEKLGQAHAAETDRWRGELLTLAQEKAELADWKEAHLRLIAEAEEVEHQQVRDQQLLVLRALIDCAHQTGAYARHPDFDSRLRRAELSTRTIEMILMFPTAIAPELAYVLACDPKAGARLAALPIVAGFFMLSKIVEQFVDAAKLRQLIGV